MATTYRDLITQSLRAIGQQALGVSANADEAVNALFELNSILDQWRNYDLMSYGITEIDAAFVVGQDKYQIGPTATGTGAIVTTRPQDVKQVVFKYASIWTNMSRLDDPEEFNRFSRLSTLSIPYPSVFRYLSDYPNGTIQIYPLPSVAYEMKVVVEQVIPQNVGLNDVVALPPGYRQCMMWMLATNLCAYYGETERYGMVSQKAESYLKELKAQNLKVPLLIPDAGINDMNSRTSGYGPFSYFGGL